MPVLDSYEPGCRLVCRADANPSPDYRWKDTDTSSIVDGSEITIRKNVKEHDAEYLYVCVAENIVRGYKRSASSEFSVKIKGMICCCLQTGIDENGFYGKVLIRGISLFVLL